MPMRSPIVWGQHNPFRDPRLANLDQFVRDLRVHRRLPPGVVGGSTFANANGDLPTKPHGYYREYDLVPPPSEGGRGKLRLVLGNGGEVYVTGNHYDDFRQILNLPT